MQQTLSDITFSQLPMLNSRPDYNIKQQRFETFESVQTFLARIGITRESWIDHKLEFLQDLAYRPTNKETFVATAYAYFNVPVDLDENDFVTSLTSSAAHAICWLYEMGVNVDGKTKYGTAMIYSACRWGEEDLMREMLRHDMNGTMKAEGQLLNKLSSDDPSFLGWRDEEQKNRVLQIVRDAERADFLCKDHVPHPDVKVADRK